MPVGEADPNWWEALFEPQPEQWGLRGDPFAWRALATELRTRRRPRDEGELTRELGGAFARVVGVALDDQSVRESVSVAEFAHGGLSSGMVHLPTWRGTLIPLLLRRGARTL